MTKYVLLDMDKNILKEIDAEEQPGDPVGKGWSWQEVVYEPDPKVTATTKLSAYTTVIADDVVMRSRTVEEILIDNSAINSEREGRLRKNYSVVLKDAGTVAINLDNDSVDTLHRLTTMAQLLISINDTRTTTYRDVNNVNHSLTPTQITEVFLAVVLQIQSVYEATWLIKDDIEVVNTLTELKEDPRWPS